MSDHNMFGHDMSGQNPSVGDGAARLTLSESIPAIRALLQQCDSELVAIRHELRGQELPRELEISEAELDRPAERARQIADDLESCADALRNASGKTGKGDMPFD